MPNITIVPDKDWEVIRPYLENGVLMPQSVFDQLTEDQKEKVENFDLASSNYNYGGEADVWLDLILSRDSYALKAVLESDDDE